MEDEAVMRVQRKLLVVGGVIGTHRHLKSRAAVSSLAIVGITEWHYPNRLGIKAQNTATE
jgi:hypothetical protein